MPAYQIGVSRIYRATVKTEKMEEAKLFAPSFLDYRI